MDRELSRVEADLRVMRSVIDGAQATPDMAMPHLLLAGAGLVSVLVAWVLDILGSGGFPLVAALAIGVPPLAAMVWWGRIRKRNPGLGQRAVPRRRLWREFWWQMLGSGILVGVLKLCGLSLISAPVILVMMVILMAGLLQRPMIEYRDFSSIGWCVAIAVLGAAMLLKWQVPGPRGAVVGYVLMLGGGLAAAIAGWTRKAATNGSAA